MLKIQKDVLLGPYTTFKIGGPAKYFAEAENVEEIQECCNWANKQKIPVLALGGGSNVLISDKGFGGLVIKIKNSKFKIKNSVIECDAGVPLAKLVTESVNAGLSGLEWAMGIPGTIGGAVFGNTGAYGHSISESVHKVRTILIDNCSVLKEYTRKDCIFAYRSSNFRNLKEIIVSVELELFVGKKEESLKTIKDIISQRKIKIPPFPSAGSFFRNYKLTKNAQEDPLIKRHPELLQKMRGGKVPTGYLLEQCDLKGVQIGGAMIANEHTNFIVNLGGATAENVLALIGLCKEKVKEKYGFELEIEKRLLGFDDKK